MTQTMDSGNAPRHGPTGRTLGANEDAAEAARDLVASARSRGYAFAMLYVDADAKRALADGGALAALADDGVRVSYAWGPDVTRRDRGVTACEFVMLRWGEDPFAVVVPVAAKAKPKPKAGPKAKAKPRARPTGDAAAEGASA